MALEDPDNSLSEETFRAGVRRLPQNQDEDNLERLAENEQGREARSQDHKHGVREDAVL